MQVKKFNLILMIIFGIILAYFIIASIITFNCGTNGQCFNNKAQLCQPAKYNYVNDGNIFEYRIIGNARNNTCQINIKLLKVSEGASLETKNLFENKLMTCYFPKQLLKISPVQETSGLLGYCSGPLKEATLELMIKKLYGTIAQNLGDVLKKIYNNETINSITNPGYINSNGSLN